MKFKTARIMVMVFLSITLVFAMLAWIFLPGLQTQLTIACTVCLALTFIFWSQFCKCPHCGKSLLDILSKEERYKEIAPKSAPRLK